MRFRWKLEICGVVLNLQIKNSKIQNASTERFEILKL